MTIVQSSLALLHEESVLVVSSLVFLCIFVISTGTTIRKAKDGFPY